MLAKLCAVSRPIPAWFVAVFLGFCSGGGVPLAQAQTGTGDIVGFVKDATGAVIPAATVTAKMVEQQAVRTTETNPEGYYSFLALPPGTYEVTFEMTGFQTLIRTGLELTPNQNLRVDGNLQVGTLEAQVEVTAAAPLVESTSATLSGLIDDRRVVDLPLNGRNVMELARILPGVLGVSAPQRLAADSGGPTMNVNGGRGNMNQFTFNGGLLTHPVRNTGLNYPPPDAIEEVSILTHNFAAEFGRNPGAQISAVSKTGTNEFHGSLWNFLRNDNLNARDFFASRVAGQVQNQFGAAAGGPIVKDSLFVFGTYQGLRDRREASSTRAFVPSAAQRAGDLSGLGAELFNPVDALTGEPFSDASGNPCVVNNVIAPGCISPVSQRVLEFIPQTPSGEVVSLAPAPADVNTYMIRLDFNATDAHRIFGHYFDDDNDTSRGIQGNIPNYIGENRGANTRQWVVNDTYIFSPTLLNEFTFTRLRTFADRVQTPDRPPSDFGMNMAQYPDTGGFSVNVSGNFNAASGFTVQTANTSYQFKDSMNWIKGKHNFKLGYELIHIQYQSGFIGSPGFSFNGSRSGHPLSDFLLGAFQNLNLNFGSRFTDRTTNAHAAYFQDEYRIRPGFTLTYGIRYEPFLPWVEKNDRINTICPGQRSTVVADAPRGICFPGDPGIPRGLAPNDYNNFAPRLGFAWDVTGDGKTSVRGGYGLFYESINADSLSQENAPFAGSDSIFNGRWEDPFGSVGRTPPPAKTSGAFGCVETGAAPGFDCPLFPLPINSGLYTSSTLRTPYIQSVNFSIQRQLTETVMVETAYAGKIGIKLPAFRPYNPAQLINSPIDGSPPSLQNANDRVIFEPGILGPNGFLLGNDFRNWYHSFQAQVTKRFSKGWSLLGSYTLAKSIDSSSTITLGATVSNPFDLRTEQGRSSWDRRHAFVASWLWSPPTRHTGVAKALLDGWTLTGIHTIQSGQGLTFTMGDDVALDATFGSQHAELVPGVTHEDIKIDHSSRDAMIGRFFNTDAFVPTNDVPRGVYGNSGRGLISGPALVNADFAIMKDFTLREPVRLQFRTELFNAFNQVNFGSVNTTVASGSFGRILNSGSGRVIQFALKLLW